MYAVVGSGPSGVACAWALLARGLPVTLLDVGRELEPERRRVVERLASRSPEDWPPEWVEELKGPERHPHRRGEKKTLFGSDFAYRPASPDGRTRIERGATAYASSALGGLSNVWGATLLPCLAAELDGWPCGIDGLAPHYRAVLDRLPFAGARDALDLLFPAVWPAVADLDPSPQGQRLLERLAANESALARRGVRFGRARLAVTAPAGGHAGCVYCGLCLHGCPYGWIWNAGRAIEQLRGHPSFRYRPDARVTAVRERAEGVDLVLTPTGSGPQTVAFDRVFLACGPLETARILLASRERFDRPLRMLASQYFLIPLLDHESLPGVGAAPQHTLAQVFLEVRDPRISPRLVHLQLYTYNDHMRSYLRRRLGPLAGPIGRPFLERLLVVQGYLHSDDSSTLDLVLTRSGRGTLLSVRGHARERGRQCVRAVVRKLLALRGLTGAVPLLPLAQAGLPGAGWHAGATFPMRPDPARFAETDRLGRPWGMARTHVVDSSVLPTIPATPITLSVMANAHRIGAACPAAEAESD